VNRQALKYSHRIVIGNTIVCEWNGDSLATIETDSIGNPFCDTCQKRFPRSKNELARSHTSYGVLFDDRIHVAIQSEPQYVPSKTRRRTK
jgi:hypothetical protein